VVTLSQHASELGILLTSQPQRLHSPEDIDLVIDALHARQHSGYHPLASSPPAASFGASHGPPAAEAAFAMLASHTVQVPACPDQCCSAPNIWLAQRNAALASPPTSFFSLNRDSPEELSAAGWQIDAVEHEPYWGIPAHWAAGSWRQWHWAAMLRQQAVGWHAQENQHWAGIALPPEAAHRSQHMRFVIRQGCRITGRGEVVEGMVDGPTLRGIPVSFIGARVVVTSATVSVSSPWPGRAARWGKTTSRAKPWRSTMTRAAAALFIHASFTTARNGRSPSDPPQAPAHAQPYQLTFPSRFQLARLCIPFSLKKRWIALPPQRGGDPAQRDSPR
jgi:hypothetical protein